MLPLGDSQLRTTTDTTTTDIDSHVMPAAEEAAAKMGAALWAERD